MKTRWMVHVPLDAGDVHVLREHLPEMTLNDAVRHVLDVWVDARMGPSPDDVVAMLEEPDAGADE